MISPGEYTQGYRDGHKDAIVAVRAFLRAYADTFTLSPVARNTLRKAAMVLEEEENE